MEEAIATSEDGIKLELQEMTMETGMRNDLFANLRFVIP